MSRPQDFDEALLIPIYEGKGPGPAEAAIAEERPKGTFASLRHRNYRLYFLGQLVSLCGTWMQSVALPWYVYELTESKLKLGMVSALNGLPMLLFSFVGGATADRFPKRYVMLFTQAGLMVCAFAFWGFMASGLMSFRIVCILAFTSGMIFSLDMPARQSFVVEMVGKADLMNAIALNSSLFNAARIVGPSLGGVVIGALGVQSCFLLNGLSYLAIIAALLMMKLPAPPTRRAAASFFRNIVDGLHYSINHPVISSTLVIIAITSIFGAPYFILLPVFAKDILRVGPDGLGMMMAASGMGAVTGALGLASLGNFRRKGALLLSAILVFSITIGIFSCSRWVGVSVACLVITGCAMTLYGSTCNTLLQTTVPDELRGRVMALFSLGFVGVAPIGSMQAGFLAQHFGADMAVRVGAIVTGTLAFLLLVFLPQMRRA